MMSQPQIPTDSQVDATQAVSQDATTAALPERSGSAQRKPFPSSGREAIALIAAGVALLLIAVLSVSLYLVTVDRDSIARTLSLARINRDHEKSESKKLSLNLASDIHKHAVEYPGDKELMVSILLEEILYAEEALSRRRYEDELFDNYEIYRASKYTGGRVSEAQKAKLEELFENSSSGKVLSRRELFFLRNCAATLKANEYSEKPLPLLQVLQLSIRHGWKTDTGKDVFLEVLPAIASSAFDFSNQRTRSEFEAMATLMPQDRRMETVLVLLDKKRSGLSKNAFEILVPFASYAPEEVAPKLMMAFHADPEKRSEVLYAFSRLGAESARVVKNDLRQFMESRKAELDDKMLGQINKVLLVTETTEERK